jgi:hypothetical protein
MRQSAVPLFFLVRHETIARQDWTKNEASPSAQGRDMAEKLTAPYFVCEAPCGTSIETGPTEIIRSIEGRYIITR